MNPLLEQISAIVGPHSIIQGQAVSERRAGIWRNDSIQAKAIVKPTNSREISETLKICNNAKQTVVTHGGLSNLVHSADTQADDIVISLERMNKIEEIDPIGRTICSEAGTILQNLQNASSDSGLYLPLDLGARGSCTIGGNIATNAGGNKVIRFGMTRDLVLGLEAVLADGTIISSMNTVIKNNSGYDLKQLFIGSEGTLGIITRAVLRLREQPESVNTALLATQRFENVLCLLRYLDNKLAGGLCAFEVMWNNFYATVAGSPPLAPDYPYYILVEAFGADDTVDRPRFETTLEQALKDEYIIDAVVAKSEKERQNLWAIRDNVERLNQFKPLFTFDISLPLAYMSGYVDTIQKDILSHYPDSHCFIFGHLGDNNLHIVVAPEKQGCQSTQARENIEKIIYNPLSDKFGSISAEHGIGVEKKPYLFISRSDEEINLMRQLKRSLDPNNILNPGKIFDL